MQDALITYRGPLNHQGWSWAGCRGIGYLGRANNLTLAAGRAMEAPY